MDKRDDLADGFEANRSHLRAVAYRMLGSVNDADDAVQEAWLRLSRSDTATVENLGGWLTTVVARVSLDMLRSRKARREQPVGTHVPRADREPRGRRRPRAGGTAAPTPSASPCSSCSRRSSPAERLAFVLHDMFAVPFDEIAPIVGRSPTAARQLASRARRRVRGAAPAPDADRARQRQVVDAFLAAARGGDFDALLAVLDPDVVLRVDRGALATSREVRGAAAVIEQARTFARLGRFARPARVNGSAGFVVASPTGAARRRRLCDRRRADRRDRPARRPGAAAGARPERPTQLTLPTPPG